MAKQSLSLPRLFFIKSYGRPKVNFQEALGTLCYGLTDIKDLTSVEFGALAGA